MPGDSSQSMCRRSSFSGPRISVSSGIDATLFSASSDSERSLNSGPGPNRAIRIVDFTRDDRAASDGTERLGQAGKRTIPKSQRWAQAKVGIGEVSFKRSDFIVIQNRRTELTYLLAASSSSSPHAGATSSNLRNQNQSRRQDSSLTYGKRPCQSPEKLARRPDGPRKFQNSHIAFPLSAGPCRTSNCPGLQIRAGQRLLRARAIWLAQSCNKNT